MRRTQVERELDEELRYHIEQQTEQNIRLGMNPEEARFAARKAFDVVEQARVTIRRKTLAGPLRNRESLMGCQWFYSG
jgi:hypothetical protein